MTTIVKMIKHDAIIKINIGTGFVQKLQKLLLDTTSNVTQEQLAEYKLLAETQQPFTEEWMESLTTLSVLLKEIESKAQEQGFIIENEINLEDNQLDHPIL